MFGMSDRRLSVSGGRAHPWKDAKRRCERTLLAGVTSGICLAAGCAWSAEFIQIEELSPEVQNALAVLADALGGDLGILDVTIVDPKREYTERKVLISGDIAAVVSFPTELSGLVTLEEPVSESTITLSINPECKWKEIDGEWVLVPSPPCPAN